MAKKKDDISTPAQHLALYRTYRPQSFKEVRGQDHVVSVLEAAIKKGAFAHAYIFAGTRGTGKTSIARILARELGVSERDVYEMDAASNRGVDDVREIREGVPVLPFESPYKVYIIDEAHMLTKEAWNALLKTLEEPPPHVIFILATTELNKVPDTIRSRCEVYTFTQPSRELLSETVADVAKKEGYALGRSASDLIAILAEGSFRDALGILQKVLTVSKDSKIDVLEVEQVTGAPSSSILRDMTLALARKDTDASLTLLRRAAESNIDARTFTKLLMQRVRAVMLIRNAPQVAELMKGEFTEADFADLTTLGNDPQCAITSHTLRALLEAYELMARAALPFLPLELAVVELSGSEIA